MKHFAQLYIRVLATIAKIIYYLFTYWFANAPNFNFNSVDIYTASSIKSRYSVGWQPMHSLKITLVSSQSVCVKDLIESLRSTTRPAQRRACERKKSVMQDKNCE